MPDQRAFLEAILEQLQRPSVETMGLEELRSEVIALRQNMRTLYGVWQEAEDDVEKAGNEGAAWMQRECLDLAREWTKIWSTGDTLALIEGLEDIPLPNQKGDDDAE